MVKVRPRGRCFPRSVSRGARGPGPLLWRVISGQWFGKTGRVGDAAAKPNNEEPGSWRLFKKPGKVNGIESEGVRTRVLLGFACFGPLKERYR